MGLKGINDPEGLWHFAGYTYCPWCGKSRQNEGTVVNHLRMVHYKLGLICDQCFWLPYNYVRHSLQTWPHHLHQLGHYLQGGYSVCLPMESI